MQTMTPRSRGAMRPSFAKTVSPLLGIEGVGNAGCPIHPQPRVQMVSKAHERSHHRSTGNHPAFPHAMVYGLISCSPRRRIRLVTVVRGLKVCPNPVGPTSL